MALPTGWQAVLGVVLGATIATVGAPAPGVAPEAELAPIACGVAYQVQPGDTLHSIAMRAYGSGDYPAIQLANSDALPDVSTLYAGLWLLIPCRDGTGPASRAEARALGMLPPPRPAPRDPAIAAALASAPGPESEPEPMTFAAAVAIPHDLLADVATGSVTLPSGAGAGTRDLVAASEPDPAGLDAPLPSALPQSAPLAAPAAPAPARLAALPAGPLLPGGAVAGTQLAAATPGWKAAPDPSSAPIRLLAGPGFAPFAGADLPGGGMIAEMLARALQASAPAREVRLSFAAERQDQLAALLPGGRMDVGFPWIRPDCAQAEGLAPQAQLLCSAFLFSAPLYELRLAWYRRVGAPEPAEPVAGRTCRGVASPALELVAPAGPDAVRDDAAGCLARLVAGEVDAAMLMRWQAERLLVEPAIAGRVVEIAADARTYKLHAIVARDNPKAEPYLALIDDGMARIMLAGDWFRVVSTHQRGGLALAQ